MFQKGCGEKEFCGIYDNKNIVGVDFKQPVKMHGLAIISNKNRFVDVAQGIFRMRNMNISHTLDYITFDSNIELDNLANDYIAYVNDFIAYLHEMSNELEASKDSDLLNIRDTMLSELNRLKYLLTLQ